MPPLTTTPPINLPPDDVIKYWMNLPLPRKNQADLTSDEKKEFNSALEVAWRSGAYDRFVAIHADMSHRMHNIGDDGIEPQGQLRFLPWHRAFLHQFERELQSPQTYLIPDPVGLGQPIHLTSVALPRLRIPYWDWANDQTIPSWLWLPPTMKRQIGPYVKDGNEISNAKIHSWADIEQNVLPQTSFEGFVQVFEGYHDDLHSYFFPGDLGNGFSRAPLDPLFWLIHSYIDRIWAMWQMFHVNQLPPLSNRDAIMDPWSLTVDDLKDVRALSYSYLWDSETKP